MEFTISEKVMLPTICLNMIVKNETQIIQRLLESVLPIIDCYLICDTGSTDNTIELIDNFFKKHKIPGKVIQEPFQDFAYNRNFALRSCLGMSDYVLVLDADMVLQNTEKFDKTILLQGDSFFILQGNDDFYYQNTRIIRNNGLYYYVGVTHEFISTPSNNIYVTISKPDLFILDIGDGGSKSNKYERDIKLLTDALAKDPEFLKDRYNFYLANTYRDCGRWTEAIESYIKRIECGGWHEEIWYSYYRIGECYKNMGNICTAIYYWLLGYDFYPDRIENIYEIVQHYRIIAKHKLCKHFYDMAKAVIDKKLNRDGYLFLQNDVYTYKIEYELSIIAMYIGIYNVNDQVVSIFNVCNDCSIINNVLSNMKFYKDILTPIKQIDIGSIANRQLGESTIKFYSSSSCIIPKTESENYLMNIRFVNYRIDDSGNYLDCENNIITMNKFVEIDKNFNIINEKQFIVEDDGRRYLGVEDIRIFPDDKNPHEFNFIGTGYQADNTIGVVCGEYNINENILKPIEIKPLFTKTDCEKNWVNVFYKNKNHIIYGWYPLRICKINTETKFLELVETKTKLPKIFSHLRGSTCGFTFDNEIWFISHIVSYEKPRHYYHIFAVFDLNMNLQRYSAPFKFEGEPIEYCVGLIVEHDRLIVPYSTWDRTTKIAIYNKTYINTLIKYMN